MGDMIEKIGAVQIGESHFDIEMNHSVRGLGYRDIHIQNEKFRLEVPENEFLQMASCILLAKRQFDIVKGKFADEQ